jgi:hypothetical protein
MSMLKPPGIPSGQLFFILRPRRSSASFGLVGKAIPELDELSECLFRIHRSDHMVTRRALDPQT